MSEANYRQNGDPLKRDTEESYGQEEGEEEQPAEVEKDVEML